MPASTQPSCHLPLDRQNAGTESDIAVVAIQMWCLLAYHLSPAGRNKRNKTVMWTIYVTMVAVSSFVIGSLIAASLCTGLAIGGAPAPASESSPGRSNVKFGRDLLQTPPPSSTEITFENTFRSCLSPKCYDKPMGEAGDMVRIGLLSVPGTGYELLNELKEEITETPKSHHLVFDTHVPAYGYGKNHGWSRIIRFSRNILEHAFFLVSERSPAGHKLKEMYEAQVVLKVSQLLKSIQDFWLLFLDPTISPLAL